MSAIYLIRHGQAGLRQRYDTLSELGRLQARRLGEYFATRPLAFRAMYCGALERQRETAAEFCAAYRNAGLDFPRITADPGWNEFDLEGVYREMVPALSAADPHFREQYEALLRRAADENHAVHHTWSSCDVKIARAWIEGRFACTVESWAEFNRRIRHNFEAFTDPGGAVAIFTSAVPIAIWAGMALGVSEGNIMKLAGVMYNSAVTSFRLDRGELSLFSFNTIPHLPEPELRTFR